jgi:hypothetical protein
MERQHMKGVLGLLSDATKDGEHSAVQLDIQNFKQAIAKVWNMLRDS